MVKGPWFPGCVLRSKGHPFGFARVWVSVVFWMDPFRSWFFGVKEKSESPLILSFFLCVLVPLCFPTFCAPTTAIILPSFSLGEATLSFAKRTGEKCLAFKQIIQQGRSNFLFFFSRLQRLFGTQTFDFQTAANCGRRRLSGGGNYASYEVTLSCVSLRSSIL